MMRDLEPTVPGEREGPDVDRAWRRGGAAQIHIAAPPTAVYGRILDVAAIGRRSLECHRASWLDGPAPGEAGSRFRGHNRAGLVRWSRVCEVIEAEPGRRFTFRTVPERLDPTRADATRWTYAIEPDDDGSLVTHAYRIERFPIRPLRWIYGKIMPHHRDMRPHLRYTLEALRAELENGDGAAPDPNDR